MSRLITLLMLVFIAMLCIIMMVWSVSEALAFKEGVQLVLVP